MFLKEIISHINSKIAETGYFTKSFDLCELKEVGEKSLPKYYCGGGEWKEVFNVDYEKGLSYIRKNGDVSIDTVDGIIGCENLLKIGVKLKLIAAIKRMPEQIIDDNYSSDRIALMLLKSIQNNNDKVLKTVIKARQVSISFSSYTTNNADILNSEFKKFDNHDLPHKYSFIMVEVNIDAIVSKDCLTSDCLTNE